MPSGMYSTIHLLEIMRRSAFKSPLSYPSSQIQTQVFLFVQIRLKQKTPQILLRLWQTGCMYANRPLFQQTGLQKLRELYIFCLEGGLVSPKRARNTGCAAFWRIFSSNKSVPANRKKGFFGSRLPKNEEIKGTVPLTNQVCICPHPIYMYSALSSIYFYPVFLSLLTLT